MRHPRFKVGAMPQGDSASGLRPPKFEISLKRILQAAKGINERGQIIAWGFDSRLGGGARAYLLTPAEYP
jgi:hypothetical protein